MAPSADPSPSPHPSPRRILLFSAPRTASNLLVRILNVHNRPDVLTNDLGGYFFIWPFLKPVREFKKTPHQWTAAERAVTRDGYQAALDELEELATRAEREGKTLFVKEHGMFLANPDVTDPPRHAGGPDLDFFRLSVPDRYVHGGRGTFSPNNHTVLPDEYLAAWRIAFVIRHPALAWPSFYRASRRAAQLGPMTDKMMLEDGQPGMSLRWIRAMFDWCAERSSAADAQAPPGQGAFPPPAIIDAQDIIHSPKALVRFCQAVGLDPAALQFEWPAEDAQAKRFSETPADDEMFRAFLGTLVGSRGVIKDLTPPTVDVEAEAVKWRAEFGDEIAKVLEKKVRDSMPDYEYLRARCVRA
ncbi:hypothetical protein VTJ83DRAFT_7180 [Remersonia thermophila]|uniref:Sulfotransferase family protein n=1 Tax=Remersonia thermophila TaxID=72144 RepID=A0ABR4D2R4_9PEZI